MWEFDIVTSSAHTHTRGATQALWQRELLFELGGGLQQKCVSHILTSISPGRRDFSLCVTVVLCQVFIILSFIFPFPILFLACIGWYFLHCLMQELLFFIPPPPLLFFTLVHFFTSPLSLVPPLLLACLALFSLPHFLCALQWFFRFFPTT